MDNVLQGQELLKKKKKSAIVHSAFFNGGLTSLSVGWQRGGEDRPGC